MITKLINHCSYEASHKIIVALKSQEGMSG